MPTVMLNGFQTPQRIDSVRCPRFRSWRRPEPVGACATTSAPKPMWQYEGLGLGNMARIKEQRGEQSVQIVELFKAQDAVAGDVARRRPACSRPRCACFRPSARCPRR